MNKKEFMFVAAVATMGSFCFAHGGHHNLARQSNHDNCTNNHCEANSVDCPRIDHSHCTSDFCVATGGANNSCPHHNGNVNQDKYNHHGRHD